MKDFEKIMKERFPMVKKYDTVLFEDYMHHQLVMEQIAKKMCVPLEELMYFFYKGKIKRDLIEREEKEYARQSNYNMREVSESDGFE